MGGDIVNICSKNAVFAGPNNIAYSSAKAAQAHMVRLLAAELGDIGVRVNGINPTDRQGFGHLRGWLGRVAGQDLRCGGGGPGQVLRTADRAQGGGAAGHVASAVVALTNGSLPVTTGLVVPVDSGVPAAFLR